MKIELFVLYFYIESGSIVRLLVTDYPQVISGDSKYSSPFGEETSLCVCVV